MNSYVPQNPAPTFESVWAALERTDRILTEKFAETERILKEMAAENKERERENERERKERELKRERERKERERENDRYLKKMFAETDKQLKINSREIGGISHSNGEVAESYFINSFKKYPHFAGQDYYFVEPNKSYYSAALDMQDEYDLVLYNGISVVIIEIKYKVRKDDIEQTLKKAETFRKLFPQYKDYAIYLGLAGLHVYKNAEDEALKHGIAVIKQVGKNRIINDEHLKTF